MNPKHQVCTTSFFTIFCLAFLGPPRDSKAKTPVHNATDSIDFEDLLHLSLLSVLLNLARLTGSLRSVQYLVLYFTGGSKRLQPHSNKYSILAIQIFDRRRDGLLFNLKSTTILHYFSYLLPSFELTWTTFQELQVSSGFAKVGAEFELFIRSSPVLEFSLRIRQNQFSKSCITTVLTKFIRPNYPSPPTFSVRFVI